MWLLSLVHPKRVWTPVLDEILSTGIEIGNPHDEYAVVLILDGLLLIESRALLVIVLCGICVILRVEPELASFPSSCIVHMIL